MNFDNEKKPHETCVRYEKEAENAVVHLFNLIERSDSTTIQEIVDLLKNCFREIQKRRMSNPSVTSACELFNLFVTRFNTESTKVSEMKEEMLDRGRQFINTMREAPENIARTAHHIIPDGSRVLVCANSPITLAVLKAAYQKGKRNIKAYVQSEGGLGDLTVEVLSDIGIISEVVCDAAIAPTMLHMDLILVEARGVMMNGGVLNTVGTFGLALCARALDKPFYVCAPRFRFSTEFPLSHEDILSEWQYEKEDQNLSGAELIGRRPLADYIPPEYISCIFTDENAVPPDSVAAEVINMLYC